MSVGEAQVEAVGERVVPARVVGRIETDVFCGGCHYNLHGLDVVCDERLDLAVVRCPECGKHQAAGISTGAGRVWLTRLGTFLVTAWVVTMLVGVFVLGLAMVIVDAGQMEAFGRYNWEDRMGPRVITLAVPGMRRRRG